MKDVIKKWWFWVIIIVLLLSIVIGVKQYIENKKLEKTFKKMGEGFSSYYKETKEADGYLDKFKYNYSSGKVDYLK